MKKVKLPGFIKKPITFTLGKIGVKDASSKGVLGGLKEAVYTRVGLENGPNREAWIEQSLKKIPAGKKLLDAGAGELKYKPLCSHLEYVSQDLGEYDGKGTDEGLHTGTWDNSKLDIVSDIVSIPVPDKSFDAVLCVEVLEHIVEPAKAIKEFGRIVQPGGKVIITAPFCSLTHFAPFYFGNGYSKYWYEKTLADNGFVIDELVLNGNYFEYLGQEIRRISSVGYRYSKTNTKWWFIYRLAEIVMLRALAKLSKRDQGSKEFLCFGVFVMATKK